MATKSRISVLYYIYKVYDTQGKRVYKSRPSPENPQSGLPDAFSVEESKLLDAGRDDPPFNKIVILAMTTKPVY